MNPDSIEREHADSIEEAAGRMKEPRRVAIHGHTLSVRQQLLDLDGVWDAKRQVWMIPEDRVEEALHAMRMANHVDLRAHIAGIGHANAAGSISACKTCGVRGDSRHPIYRSGECDKCFRRRKRGG